MGRNKSVRRGLLNVVDHNHFDRPFAFFQLEAQLLQERLRQGRADPKIGIGLDLPVIRDVQNVQVIRSWGSLRKEIEVGQRRPNWSVKARYR